MKTLAITILGVLMSITLVANSVNSIPPKGNETPKSELKIDNLCPSTDRVLEIQKQILDKEDQIKTYNIFVKTDGNDPVYIVEIQKLSIEIDELNTEMEGLIKSNKVS